MPEKNPGQGQGSTPSTDNTPPTVDVPQQPPAESPPVEPRPKLDQTVPGGKYLKDGQLVNANGEPIDETGRVLKLQ